MKVQLIVVQGKPAGKVIPLASPIFRIGRGETCHLRPNSEQVSREHAEFRITADRVIVVDLGSRNGTFVNGKRLTEPYTLKDRDLVQVGPLTFAVSIQGAPAWRASQPSPSAGPRSVPPTISAMTRSNRGWSPSTPIPPRTAPRASTGGDTITITAFRDAGASKSARAGRVEANLAGGVDVEGIEVDRTGRARFG